MPPAVEPEALKRCCSHAYESDLARMLLGDSFHPGGLDLTRRLGMLLNLRAGLRILDVASGKGESAIFLAKEFGCEVVGIDFGRQNVTNATGRAAAAGVPHLVTFLEGDAERMEFPGETFDRIICECAFCTFPDKPAAAHEFSRVLRSGGVIGLSDLTRGPVLPKELDGLLAWIACIADAQPVDNYTQYLRGAGFRVAQTESHDEALLEMVNQVRMKLLGAEIMVGLKKLDLPDVDFPAAKQMAQAALPAIQRGSLGYAIICATKA